MTIYKNQSLLNISLNTGINISAGSEFKILYKKPNNITGTWTGQLSGTTNVIYAVQPGDIDKVGKWKLQAYVVVNGLYGYGEIIEIDVTGALL